MSKKPTRSVLDFQLHTTCSDGLLSPQELVQLCIDRGLTTIAITDHDFVHPTPFSTDTLRVIPAFELSLHDGAAIDVLVYGADPHHPELSAYLEQRQQARVERAQRIINQLNSFGIELSMEDVRAIAPHTICRWHIAQACMSSARVQQQLHPLHIHTVTDVLNKLLKVGGPLPGKHERGSLEQGLAIAKQAGGTCILAHPERTFGALLPMLGNRIPRLREMGIDGIEVFYATHPKQTTHLLWGLAQQHKLLYTAGTDYHGRPDTAKPGKWNTYDLNPDFGAFLERVGVETP